eukprot:gene7825-9636_t
MKKLINDENNVVDDMINGMIKSNPLLSRLKSFNVIVRSDCRDKDGGGSGHEPHAAGFIGKGMLSAAVLGDVFSSPSTGQVFEAIKAVTGPKGCILIVKNYTGDRLNFGIAKEMATIELGVRVEMIIVNDDVSALLNHEIVDNEKKRRGIAGTILIHKLLGALSEQNYSIDEILNIYHNDIIGNLYTMGVGLSSCTIPAIGRPLFEIEDDKMEFGLGIHGEPGIERVQLLNSNQTIIQF